MTVFNEQYANSYDDLYRDKDYEKECDYLEALFKKFDYKPMRILDLGCGTGGHALILAKRGYKVTGVDKSEQMLVLARNKATDAGLDVEFIQGDISKLGLNRKFDAVISMFAVMGYQTTNNALAAACRLAHESLVPDGLFIFDCWYGPAVLSDRPTPRIKEIKLSEMEKIIRFTEPCVDLMKHTVEVNFKVWNISCNTICETDETHNMRFLFPQEIRYFLEVAGFNNVHIWPFLGLDRDLTENDWNMCVVAR